MTQAEPLRRTIVLRQVAWLLLSASMVTVGYLGLVGKIQHSPLLIAAILVTMVVLAFSLGRQSTRLTQS